MCCFTITNISIRIESKKYKQLYLHLAVLPLQRLVVIGQVSEPSSVFVVTHLRFPKCSIKLFLGEMSQLGRGARRVVLHFARRNVQIRLKPSTIFSEPNHKTTDFQIFNAKLNNKIKNEVFILVPLPVNGICWCWTRIAAGMKCRWPSMMLNYDVFGSHFVVY